MPEAVALRYEGYTDWEIAYKLGWNRQSVSRMIKRFKEKGLEEYIQNHYKGNHRNLSQEEEKAALDEVAVLAAQGPCTPCLRVREYEYAYGAVEPDSGDNFFLIMPYSNTKCMNLFLEHRRTDVVCSGVPYHWKPYSP